MIVSRKKPAFATSDSAAKRKQGSAFTIDSLDNYLERRDYIGAISLLQLIPSSSEDRERSLWIAYSSFHLGNYETAVSIYKTLVSDGNPKDPNVWTYLSCCYYMLGQYSQSLIHLEKGPHTPLRNRLRFHLSHKMRDFSKRAECMEALRPDCFEDQMSLAAIRFLQRNNDEAINIYRQLISEDRQKLALNVFIAICFHKKDYCELSQEVLSIYLRHHPQSITAINLEACNLYHLHNNGKVAKETLEKLLRNSSSDLKFAKDLIEHNMVIFQDGDGAMQVLPKLLGTVPEARQNLIIAYLNTGETEKAFDLVQEFEPVNTQEYALTAAVYATIGQDAGSMEYLEKAVQLFRLASNSEVSETILSREALASAFFLLKQFTEAIAIFDSIKSFFINDDRFNFNYGQAKMAMGLYREAIEVLLMVRSSKLKQDLVYRFCLMKSYIMAGKASLAFDFFGQLEVTSDSLLLLNIMANLCYKSGQYFIAAKSFDMLERLYANNVEIWEGKRGACVGHFQQIVAGHEPKIQLTEIVAMLKTSSNPQALEIVHVMRSWAKEHRDLISTNFYSSF